MAFEALNSGSLLKRTLVHVAAFVLGSALFVGLLSFTLTATAKALLPSSSDAASEDGADVADDAEDGAAAHAAGKPANKPARPAAAAKPKEEKVTR